MYRDPRLGIAKGPSMCDNQCGKPHGNTRMLAVVNAVTNERTPKWFCSMVCSTDWMRKEGML